MADILDRIPVDDEMTIFKTQIEPIKLNACIDNILMRVNRLETKFADVQPVSQWISVKDRLPDALYDCLVWYSCDTAFGKCKSWGIAHCSRCDWYTKHLDGDNIVVLYWMPCPEPPKDGDAK